jgi:hypothetical protein
VAAEYKAHVVQNLGNRMQNEEVNPRQT